MASGTYNYTELNLPRWKCSPGVLERTAPGGNVLQCRDIIHSSPRNVLTYDSAALAMQGQVICLDREK